MDNFKIAVGSSFDEASFDPSAVPLCYTNEGVAFPAGIDCFLLN